MDANTTVPLAPHIQRNDDDFEWETERKMCVCGSISKQKVELLIAVWHLWAHDVNYRYSFIYTNQVKSVNLRLSMMKVSLWTFDILEIISERRRYSHQILKRAWNWIHAPVALYIDNSIHGERMDGVIVVLIEPNRILGIFHYISPFATMKMQCFESMNGWESQHRNCVINIIPVINQENATTVGNDASHFTSDKKCLFCNEANYMISVFVTPPTTTRTKRHESLMICIEGKGSRRCHTGSYRWMLLALPFFLRFYLLRHSIWVKNKGISPMILVRIFNFSSSLCHDGHAIAEIERIHLRNW